MNAHEFNVPISELDAGGKEYRYVIRSPWLRGALEGHEATSTDKEGDLSIRASKSGHDVVVHGTLDAEVSVPCARCLEPTSVAIHSDITVIYVPKSRLKSESKGAAGANGADGADLTEEEADTLPFDGETVVLDDLVRDEILLEIPMIPLCSEGCPGMSPALPQDQGSASADKPIDPRLAPLLGFAQKVKG